MISCVASCSILLRYIKCFLVIVNGIYSSELAGACHFARVRAGVFKYTEMIFCLYRL